MVIFATRYRRKIVGQIASEKNRLQEILEDGNIKLSSVVSDMSGATATKIIDDIINGHDYINELELDAKLLDTIPGVGKDTAVGIIAEIGNNMNQFPNEQHLASWAGMSPGNNESAGKNK